jgi:hypothetical protein
MPPLNPVYVVLSLYAPCASVVSSKSVVPFCLWSVTVTTAFGTPFPPVSLTVPVTTNWSAPTTQLNATTANDASTLVITFLLWFVSAVPEANSGRRLCAACAGCCCAPFPLSDLLLSATVYLCYNSTRHATRAALLTKMILHADRFVKGSDKKPFSSENMIVSMLIHKFININVLHRALGFE